MSEKLCAARESNPGRKNGNLAWYHYTSGANTLKFRPPNIIADETPSPMGTHISTFYTLVDKACNVANVCVDIVQSHQMTDVSTLGFRMIKRRLTYFCCFIIWFWHVCQFSHDDLAPLPEPCFWLKTFLEMSGIEPETFHMQSERSTTELHPQDEYLCSLTFIWF